MLGVNSRPVTQARSERLIYDQVATHMRFNEEETTILRNALSNALQDAMDYADQRDYPGGELAVLVAKQAHLLVRMGGSIASIGGKNGDLLENLF